jgi:uncharacterized repeat protein (TIGR01451 family)
MRWIAHIKIARLFAVAGMSLALALLALGVLVIFTSPAQADSRSGAPVAPAQPATPPSAPLSQGDITVVKSASTALRTNGAEVADGDWITYTITVQNNTPYTLTDVIITDTLPPSTFAEPIDCLGVPCNKVQTVITITDPISGSSISITMTGQITWGIGSLAASQVISRQFKGRVVCQSDGYDFENSATVHYALLGEINYEASNPVATIVRVVAPEEKGEAQLSNGPTWCSTEATGGTYDMDWGDYDADGDLDMVVGFDTDGAVIYRNDGGQLTRLGRIHDGHVSGVRWADFDNDGLLDLLVTGASDGTPSYAPPGSYYYPNYPGTGYNYIYRNTGSDFVAHDSGGDYNGEPYAFQSNGRVFRAAVADYDDDGDVDIAAASDSYGCSLALYKNIHPGNLGKPPPSPGNDVFQAALALDWATADVICLVVDNPVYSVAWGDYDNDGLLDLAVGTYGRIDLFKQNTSHNFPTFPTTSYFADLSAGWTAGWPYDLAWGDYNNDGLLDLAAAVRNFSWSLVWDGWQLRIITVWECRVKIYRNTGGTFGSVAETTINARQAMSVDWVDVNGDGRLELAVGDSQPKIYAPPTFTPMLTLPITANSWVFRIRGVDVDNDGDKDLAFTDYAGRSLLFTTFAPFLASELTAIDGSLPATSVAWGDVDGGGPDFLLGAASSPNKLYHNNINVTFPSNSEFNLNGRSVAFGDVNGDRQLDVAFGRNGQNHIYQNGSYGSSSWQSGDYRNTYGLSFGDFDQDNAGWLDLVAGNSNGPNVLYLNRKNGTWLDPSPVWTSTLTDDTRGVAWGYYDADVFPDFAAANNGQPARIYRNDGYNRFDVAQTLPLTTAGRSVAWGDYDGDGDMDLALGNYNQPVQVYRNDGGTLNLAWTAPVARNTTSVAWGDWNNDGWLDLAVGNFMQPNQVYANLGSTSGSFNPFWLWQSAAAYRTQSVAWGDADGDGDLDLAIAADGQSGFYRNSYVAPAHLGDPYMPLPLNPTYLAIQAPVPGTGSIWRRTVLSESTSLIIPINFTVYDPDGPLQNGSRDAQLPATPPNLPAVAGQYAITTGLEYEFSLDGGGSWQPAHGTLSYDSVTRRYTFAWQAGLDLANPQEAVSDDVRFRISAVHKNKGGRVQSAMTSAISPPFRVRNLNCVWPEDALITYQPPVTAGVTAVFSGSVTAYSSQVFFAWDFGDGNPPPDTGWMMPHIYSTGGTYVITMTVTGNACPVVRSTFATATVTVAPRVLWANTFHLPIILKSGAGGAASSAVWGAGVAMPLHQVSGLEGNVRAGEGTLLRWQPGAASDAVLGYRVYRSRIGPLDFQLLAEVPPDTADYTDATAMCGYAYFVTAYNAQGESLPSTSSYYGPPCR